MLQGSTGRGSAAAPVSELPTPVAAAPAISMPRPSRARRSTRPLPATSGRRDASLSFLLLMGFLLRGVFRRPEHLRAAVASAYHGRHGLPSDPAFPEMALPEATKSTQGGSFVTLERPVRSCLLRTRGCAAQKSGLSACGTAEFFPEYHWMF